jgi:polyhydroxyalkanoate synthesis regulator protein
MVAASDPVTVKLYANRRLYEPRSGRYVTRDELIALKRDGADVTVRNAGTGTDITRFILSHRPTEH